MAMQSTYRPQDFPKISWRTGPVQLRLSGDVCLNVPAGMAAVQGPEMRRFLQASGNRIEGRELAVAGPEDLRWFAIFSHAPAGTARRRTEWVERIVEPDGRHSVLRTVILPAGGELFQVEILCEEDNAALAVKESGLLLAAVTVSSPRGQPMPPLWPPLAVAALVGVWLLSRRRLRAASDGRSDSIRRRSSPSGADVGRRPPEESA